MLPKIFLQNQNFIILALTGRTGSGCSTASSILCEEHPNFPSGNSVEEFYTGIQNKKYEVAKKYSDVHWKQFKHIKISDLITAHLILKSKDEIVHYLKNGIIKLKNYEIKEEDLHLAIIKSLKEAKEKHGIDISEEDKKTISLVLDDKIAARDIDACKKESSIKILENINKLSSIFRDNLDNLKKGLYTNAYIHAGNSIRCTGKIQLNYWEKDFDYKYIYKIPATINKIIKILRSIEKKENPCYIVIDSIKNPYEAKYFKDRYAAFYLVSINTSDENRTRRLTSVYHFPEDQQREVDEKESGKHINLPNNELERLYNVKTEEERKKLKRRLEFAGQNVKRCIESSDIHLFNPREESENNNFLKAQLAWYISLILHPGLIAPTPMERVMQVAYTAKLNSGCLSRQVGAVVTDSNGSIKSVGWNDVAQGQMPCSLRSIEGLLNDFDSKTYSDYERNNKKIRESAKNKIEIIEKNHEKLEGLNISYCFKDLKNEIDGEKNQIHTRSLHAEENAFLQLAKYGSCGIEGGKLYTTASPCELCAKKAYQLAIQEIIFIDPYPGIATNHIINIGTNKPKLTQFRGAIGHSYHRLYEQVMPIKDEIHYLTDMKL